MNNIAIHDFNFQTENEEIFIDSKIVAKGFQIEHSSLIRSIENNFERSDLKSDLIKQKSGQKLKIYLLTERQIMILPAICRTTPKTITFQTALVDAFIEARKQLSEKTSYKTPFHIQRYVLNNYKVPPEYFSMLDELYLRLMAPLETMGYIIPDDLMPDISMGKMFSGWLREKGYEPSEFPTYKHEFKDGKRRVVDARLYPNEILTDFRNYFQNIWLKEKAIKYFEKREPNILPFLEKLILQIKNKSYNIKFIGK
jgi:hypothetical protein